MSGATILLRFAHNNAWSNLRLLQACSALGPEEAKQTRTSFFPSILETLNHIWVVDLYYLDALEHGGEGLAIFETTAPINALGPLMTAQLSVDKRLVDFVSHLGDSDLGAEVRMQRSQRVQVDSVENVLMHLFVHQTHHRGQVHAMLSGTTIKPPQLDEFFMAAELPLRKAELEELGLPLR